jgi:hypothetical protein
VHRGSSASNTRLEHHRLEHQLSATARLEHQLSATARLEQSAARLNQLPAARLEHRERERLVLPQLACQRLPKICSDPIATSGEWRVASATAT